MLNQYILLGRLVKINDNSITIENSTDKIMIKVSSSILENVKNYCDIGEVVGIKGKITTADNQIELICEKCTFLSIKALTE